MAWITPKTDWTNEYDEEGHFTGDFFSYTDYNRIKNNLAILHDMAVQMFYPIEAPELGEDKHQYDPAHPDYDNDNFFADEFNAIEDGLQAIDDAIPFIDFGVKQTFMDNGRFIDYIELNRIESAELRLYGLINNAITGKQHLQLTLGMRERDIRV